MSQSKRKILFLVTQSQWGGAQEYVYNLATNLDKNQDDVVVAAGEGNGELFKALQKEKIDFRRLQWAKRSVNPIFDIKSLFELISLFKREQPDVIHLNSSKIGFIGSLAAQIYKKTHNVRIVYTAHGWVFNEPLPYLIRKLYFWIEKISARWKNVIICVSEADRQVALTNNFKSKIVTIHNAVDLDQLVFLPKNESRAFLKLNNNDLVIGAIANFYKTKGINFLIAATGLLQKHRPNLKTVIIGEGEERKNLELTIKNLKLENQVILTGNINQAHRLIKAFDLFVLPSVKEGLPYAILKAQAAGIPIVATKVGVLPKIMPADLLAQPGNVENLASKINDALGNPAKYIVQPKTDFKNFLNQTLNCYK
ncbi:MAG: glycosyltransferase family 4 protein [Candidatus Komeilibacteria bacterium]|nr:glycosyltransferase family 4 protein [Candidatus Komeilibacteria bacterium]